MKKNSKKGMATVVPLVVAAVGLLVASSARSDYYVCETKERNRIYGDKPCPVGTSVVSHQVENAPQPPSQASSTASTETAEKISVNFNKTDTRRVISTFSELTGIKFYLSDLVAGYTTIAVKDEPWDKVLYKILDQNNLTYLKTKKNNIYIYPKLQNARVAETMANNAGI